MEIFSKIFDYALSYSFSVASALDSWGIFQKKRNVKMDIMLFILIVGLIVFALIFFSWLLGGIARRKAERQRKRIESRLKGYDRDGF